MTSIYVPKDPSQPPQALQGLQRGAAILSVGRGDELAVCVCAELEHGQRRAIFADRCREAAQRLMRRGRLIRVPAADLVHVGYWDDSLGEVRLLPGRDRLLAGWLGRVAYRNDLEASDSAGQKRQEARRAARRALLQGRTDKALQIMSRHGLRGL